MLGWDRLPRVAPSPAVADFCVASVQDPTEDDFASPPPPETIGLCLDPEGREGFLPFPQWSKTFVLCERRVQKVGKILPQSSIGGLSLVSCSAPSLSHGHLVEAPWKRACKSI